MMTAAEAATKFEDTKSYVRREDLDAAKRQWQEDLETFALYDKEFTDAMDADFHGPRVRQVFFNIDKEDFDSVWRVLRKAGFNVLWLKVPDSDKLRISVRY